MHSVRLHTRRTRRSVLPLIVLIACWLQSHAQTVLILNAGNKKATLAGSGRNSITANGVALATGLGSPRAVAYDSTNTLYSVDSRNHQVTRITQDGTLTIIAGTGQEGYAGDNGPATRALLNRPTALIVDSDGTLVIADTGNHCIRSIAPDGTIRTIAGTGTPGNAGDGGPSSRALLRSPTGLVRAADGTLLIADAGNHRIRRITSAGIIEAVAGSGKEGDAGDGGPASNATFLRPSALLLLPDQRILIADAAAHRIRVLTPGGQVEAFDTASLRRPVGMALDSSGSLLIADADLQQLLQAANGGYAVLAGNAKQGGTTDSLNSPSAAALDTSGGIAVADTGNHQIQHLALPSLNFGTVPAGKQSLSQTLSLQNGSDIPLQVIAATLAAPFQLSTGSTCAPFPFTLAAHTTCSIQVAFAPQAQGTTQTVGVIQTATGPPGMLLLTGIGGAGTNLASSVTALTNNGSVSYAGAAIQFTATIAGTLLATPTGTIAFQDGGTTITTMPVTSGRATFSTSALTAGKHTLRAVYSGDATYATSTSAPLTQTVIVAPDFSLSTTASSYSGSASGTVTIPITVLPLNGTLNHSATITINGLPTGATATFLPQTVALAGDPIAITLLIKLPSTLALMPPAGWIAAALLLAFVPFRRKHRAAWLTLVLLSAQGCGGFRTTSASGSGGGTTRRYTCTISVTTTGVLNDTLTHSIPLELALTQ